MSHFLRACHEPCHEVEHSNLDYQGPDTGEEGLVYRVSKGSQTDASLSDLHSGNYKGEHMEMVLLDRTQVSYKCIAPSFWSMARVSA